MSYGKYGMKNIGAGMPNNMMGIAYNDPWFAAGALLAQNWNKNYEDRGNKKAIDAALAELSPTGNVQEQQLATQQFQGIQPQGDTLQGGNMLGIGAGYTVPTGKGLLGGEIPASNAPTATGTGLFGSIFSEKKEEPKGGLFENVLGNYPLNGAGTPVEQSAVTEQAKADMPTQGGLITSALINRQLNGSPLESTSNQMLRDYLGDYSLGKDAEGNTVLNKSQGIGDIAQGMANQRLQNFDANQWMANKQLELMRQGYSPEQIGYIMEPLAQKAAGIQQEQYKVKTGDLVSRYFDLTAQGDYNGAAKLAFEALRYDPQAANTLLSGGVAPKDIWSNDKRVEGVKLAHELNEDTANNNVVRQKDLTSFTAQLKRELGNATLEDRVKFFRALGVPDNVIQAAVTGVGKSSGRQAVSPQYKAASDYVRNWQAAHRNDLDDNWQNDATYQTALAIMQAGFIPQEGSASGGMRTVGGAQFNPNDYGSVMKHATAVLEANKAAGNKLNKKQLMDMFRFYYGDFADAVIEHADWPAWGFSGNSQPVQQQAMAPDEDWRDGRRL